MTAPLFQVEPDPQRYQLQLCNLCPATVRLSDDGLRVLGWIVYDGQSITGKTLRVRICPTCQ